MIKSIRHKGLRLLWTEGDGKPGGDWKDFWSIWVSGNYRIVFKWDGQHAHDVNYLDYH